ncbi:AbrB family transcriptional regulator [uncultured Cohaesibacter sp.]|uniref:AbrB family transcriptional regulator n=1 Tax=uncultured Cohaesibacter sp. TaxID=1002546 RepID=UPI002AA60026|nr:AbrB family transcriptional regulator [uncultured Cohaesibacter sp.]
MPSEIDDKTSTEESVRGFGGGLGKQVLHVIGLYLIAITGGALAHWVQFPAAWLTGSLLAVAITSLAGLHLKLPTQLRDLGFAQVGLILGSGFSPDMLHAIAAWPLSILMLAVTVFLIAISAYWVLRKVGGWDHATALFASLPGALSYIIVVAEESKADMTKVAIAQSLRVFVLVSILPIILMPFTDGVTSRVTADTVTLDLQHLAMMVAGVALLVPIMLRLHIPSGLMLSGIAVSGTLYLTGFYHEPFPNWFTIPGYLTVGINIGARFAAISVRDLIRLSGISMLSLLVSAGVSGGAAILCATLLNFPMGQVILAFAPGGFDTMVLLSFLINLNPAYVTGHHLVRYLGLVMLTPLIASRLTRSEAQTDKQNRS